MVTPYWKTRDWWLLGNPPHHLWGPSELADAYTDVSRVTWNYRRKEAVKLAKREEWGFEFIELVRGKHSPRDIPETPEPVTLPPRPDMSRPYKETHEIKPDGSQVSDKIVTMSEEQSKDPAFLLSAHGFDAVEWELVSAKNNIWQVFSKDEDGEHKVSTLYSSKITVRPLCAVLDIEAIAEAVRSVVPVKLARPKKGNELLEVGSIDLHFGNSTFEWYQPVLERIVGLIESRPWAEVIIPVGSDAFHCDNFKNMTSNGTLQSSVDWPAAWSDAARYYSSIIESALTCARQVYCYYIIGNHDESMSWAFCQMLAAKYPQVHFDLGIDERKVHTFGEVAIGLTHGDNRTRKDLDRVFVSEFPAFAKARVREVHAAHYHHEMSVDQYGVVTRSLSTAARTDKWHREEGFVGAMKRFMLFRFETDSLRGIEYV